MKKLYLSLFVFALAYIQMSITEVQPGNPAFDARINTYKHECKQLIKPARYEGSRVTFYNVSSNIQKKNIETYFLLNQEYKIAFSGKESSVKVNVKIFNSLDEGKRTLLKEIKNIQGKNISISSTELNKVYNKKVNPKDRLKSVFIEFQIDKGEENNEAIVTVLGYMDN